MRFVTDAQKIRQRDTVAPQMMVGESAWIRAIRNEIRLVSRHATTVLITGPSGTGKELIARSVHNSSDRSQQPFVPVDCAAAGDLFSSQLFGHRKGAFTGATAEAMGAFRAADGGTLFLDELGELDLELQAKLLRVLQERVVVPIGGLREYPINVRVIAATNRNLRKEIDAGRFREDLFYRLNVISLKTSPLRDRPEDTVPLIANLMARLEIKHGLATKPVSPEALAALVRYDWPGNVRELNNVLERAVLYCESAMIELQHLPHAVTRSTTNDVGMIHATSANEAPVSASNRWPTMVELERHHVLSTLKRTDFNQTAAARMLDVDRHALRRSIRRLGIKLPSKARDE